MAQPPRFSAQHPFLFGFLLIVLAVILLIASMMLFSSCMQDGKKIPFFNGGEKIGVVNVQGLIASSRTVTAWIDQLQQDDSIKGVIVRINSPGGVVGPSQEIFQAVRRLAASKPTIASMGAVAASGGYYIAAGASEIWANPGTLTASIGVKAQLKDMGELMHKLGIKEQTVTSGSLKNAGTMFRPMTPEEKIYFQELVDDLHDQFVTDVASSRHMDQARVKAVADGRAMTGRQALQAGLVDKMGGFEDAVRSLKKALALTKDPVLIEGPETKRPLLSRILGSLDIIPSNAMTPGPQWVFSYE
ncbi:MAG: signal peptide peptidase SppA [Desulfoplanes sp.]